ncbi:excinuclease ABC subunit UvrA [Kallipyga massiliensis]|uniref:excinuclease ABC subunit UvrA n=1 Tax=Kallipyga massiliensis TaxID=1472764 RepID=UPI0004BBD0E4|nr:excinuclease ABC subunit UvrA [Kallipyga massiliensis]
MSLENIVIKGAKVNNLKDVDLTLPRNKMIVMTGLSGSGKSSLAFDTIYAEGQRRYVESLSSYARMFLGQMDKPDVDLVEGLSPAISIDQKTTNRNPRSTVSTVTEINDYLRLLFAKAGHAFCPACGAPIEAMSVDEIVDSILALPDRTRILVLSPVIRGKKGMHKNALSNLQKRGFSRVLVDGVMRDLIEDIELEKNLRHDISIVVDRLIVREGIASRLTSSVETALAESGGTVIVDQLGPDKEVVDSHTYSSKLACPEGHMTLEEIEPRLLSFNSPLGACPDCSGLGFHAQVDAQLCIPNPDLSIEEGAVAPYATSGKGTFYYEMIRAVAQAYDWPLDQPIGQAPDEVMDALLWGSDRIVTFSFNSHFSGQKTYRDSWEGTIPNLTRRFKSGGEGTQKRIRDFMAENTCETCHGDRLRPEALSVHIADKNIAEFNRMSIQEAYDWTEKLTFSESEAIIAAPILKEVRARLKFLIDVGLDYLTLDRYAATLSGGESQRIRLATQIGAGLVGVVYVLDEPSIGLHQRDNNRLLAALRNLTDLGNTLIIVEHDEDTMRAADWIVDVGPGAGLLGGQIVAQGPFDKIIQTPGSITGDYLAHRKFIPVPEERRTPSGWLKVKGCRENNLKGIDVKIPLGVLTAITGVSGSGKSSFVEGILYKVLANRLNKAHIRPGKYKGIEGLDQLDKVIEIDQSPIGRTPRSNPATYTKVFDLIRDVFASSNDAKMRGYDKGRFSFNVKGGRCEACKGDGTIKVEMHFLPDVYVPCEVCHGARYNRETLQVRYRGKTIADVLEMTIEEALDFFKNHAGIQRKLQTLVDVGLGYLKVGQPSPELSGGEAQRVKLAAELGKVSTGRTIYILDEPTTGLHVHDIDKLVKVFDRLIDQGNSIVVIEHNLDVIKYADYIVDLGPEGGARGGEIVTEGTPEEVARDPSSYTGKFLAPVLDRDRTLGNKK